MRRCARRIRIRRHVPRSTMRANQRRRDLALADVAEHRPNRGGSRSGNVWAWCRLRHEQHLL